MPKHGKKYSDAIKSADLSAYYEPADALETCCPS